MNLKHKNLQRLFFLLLIIFILVGCVQYDSTGNPSGWVYEYLGRPTIFILDWIAGLFNNSYGMAIIIVTIITRLIMLPSSLKMTKSTMLSSAKMEVAQPEIKEIQEEMQLTDDPQEKARLNQELSSVYKKYDINMFGDTLGGCLPIILQMPIISAVYAAIRSSETINNSSFLGISFGERSVLIVALVVLVYFLQGWLMQKATPTSSNPQAQQTSQTMLFMNPIMFGWISWAAAAGLGLYFLVGGIFAIGQQN